MIELKCNNCDSLFKRKEFDLKSKIERNQIHFFCSKKCSNSHVSEILKKQADNKKDELSPYRWYIRTSKYRKKETDLTPEYLKEIFETQNKKCVYTLVDLQLWNYKNKGKSDKIYTASLDRIDSNKGYIKENVQFVSMAANLFKHTMTDLETKEFIKTIIKNHKIKT